MPQFADLFVNILSEPAEVKLNKYGSIQVVAGNCGNDSVKAETVRLIVTCGNNTRITSMNKNPKWRLKSLSTEKTGNTAQLINKAPFSSFDLVEFNLNLLGVKRGDFSIIASNITYIVGNAGQGNMSNTNDNSTTSVKVI